ncbi:uncharacterized protein LOC128997031 [Macrosteles quadrilineatus]|uniref:uncharacterized protein LOC128997031 n=1 Tax=Macrosteles quadrilineatus TaxID=74068 RepID=UPI0023E1E2B4|nr:uncharacterized protein LOC128997031 [Macrosteles quadrilineatus]
MDKLKSLKTKRTQLRRTFTKCSNEMDKLLAEDIKDEAVIKSNLNKLQDKADRLFKLDEDIEEALFEDPATTEEDLEAEFDTTESYRDMLSSMRAKYDHFIIQVGLSQQSRSEVGDNVHSLKLASKKGLSLPKLQLNQFDGDVKNWIRFWGQFKKDHEDPDLEPEDKFQYLIQSLKPGSSPRELVESFPPSGTNYVKALEQLKARFGRDDFLIEVYVRELLSLVLQQVTLGPNTKLCRLYDKLETQLRALETLGVTSDKYASMLYPLVESALPEEPLQAWERHRSSKLPHTPSTSTLSDDKSSNFLQELLDFLKAEVESEERLALARSSFKSATPGENNSKCSSQKRRSAVHEPRQSEPTVAALLTTGTEGPRRLVSNCTYCSKGGHNAQDCFYFQQLTLDGRKKHLRKKNCCFVCLKQGHTAKKCKVFVKCLFCGKRHYGIMCRDLFESRPRSKIDVDKPDLLQQSITEPKSEVLSNFGNGTGETLLQTLLVKVADEKGKEYLGRALLDPGSQRSYITKDCVTKLGLQETGSEVINHSLFGGVNIKQKSHKNYLVTLQNVNNSFKISIPVTDQETICNHVPRLKSEEYFDILKEKNIILTDVGENVPDVKILLGADVLVNLYTGTMQKIDDKLVAIETYLGWTVMGKQPCIGSRKMSLLTLFCQSKSEIKDLWSLETIGIKDPIEVKQRDSIDAELFQHFKENVRVNVENRYEVCLPWLEGHPELLDNHEIAERRLMSSTRRLNTLNKFNDYDKVFKEWLEEGIIENVPESAESTKINNTIAEECARPRTSYGTVPIETTKPSVIIVCQHQLNERSSHGRQYKHAMCVVLDGASTFSWQYWLLASSEVVQSWEAPQTPG